MDGFTGTMLFDWGAFSNMPVTFNFLHVPDPSYWGYVSQNSIPYRLIALDRDYDGVPGSMMYPFFDFSMTLDFCVGGTFEDYCSYDYLTSVPVSAAFWLFGSGLIGLIGFARREYT